MPNPQPILLAAGASTRFGPQNKLLSPLPDAPHMITACLSALNDAFEAAPLVILGHEHELIAAACASHRHIALICERWREGMGSSLAMGAHWLLAQRPDTAAIVALADMPWISPQTLHHLNERALSAPPDHIIAPCYQGQRGHPVSFGATHISALAALSGDQGARELIRANADKLTLLHVEDPGVLMDRDHS